MLPAEPIACWRPARNRFCCIPGLRRLGTLRSLIDSPVAQSSLHDRERYYQAILSAPRAGGRIHRVDVSQLLRRGGGLGVFVTLANSAPGMAHWLPQPDAGAGKLGLELPDLRSWGPSHQTSGQPPACLQRGRGGSMRTGAAIARHPDWRGAPADLTGQIPLLSGEDEVHLV